MNSEIIKSDKLRGLLDEYMLVKAKELQIRNANGNNADDPKVKALKAMMTGIEMAFFEELNAK